MSALSHLSEKEKTLLATPSATPLRASRGAHLVPHQQEPGRLLADGLRAEDARSPSQHGYSATEASALLPSSRLLPLCSGLSAPAGDTPRVRIETPSVGERRRR